MSGPLIERVAAPARRQTAAGLSIAHVHPQAIGWDLDPFLQIDWFRMSQPFFPPHPHAGFSAVTYMLPESPGGFVNRDSLGDRSRIRPGALHWTEAARGMMHAEVPEHPGTVCSGLQMFVNLPAARKLDTPATYHVEPDAVPVARLCGGEVRVLAGACGTVEPAVRPRTEAVLWDVTLAPDAWTTLEVQSAWSLAALLCAGSVRDDARHLEGECVLRFAPGAPVLRLRGGPRGARLVIFGGVPLREPTAVAGPFVMSTPQELRDAQQRYFDGGMGRLSPSFNRE